MNKKTIAAQLDHVFFQYQDHPVLNDINLSISKGEKIVLLGANGCGKSTLLQLLDGLLFPTRGTYTAFDKGISPKYFSEEKNEYEFRRQVGYVFQDSDAQLFCPTVWDEVAFAPLHMGFSKEEVGRRTNNALEVMHITHLKNRIPHQLSGGEKKRVALASIFSYQPTVWLFDEPTAGLDPQSQSTLIDIIYSLHEKKHTIITATHDLSILSEIADRVIVLSEAHTIVADDTPKNILSNKKLLLNNNLIHAHTHHHKEKTHAHIHAHYIIDE